MIFTLDAIVTACVYVSSAIATLRAGSRALYTLKNDGLSIMGGPLILSPADVMDIKKKSSTASKDKAEISKLWESAYGFQRAVKLALPGKPVSHGGRSAHEEEFGAIIVGNIAIENQKRNYYSLASPHKSYPTQDHVSHQENDCCRRYLEDEVEGKASTSVSSGRGIRALQTFPLPLKYKARSLSLRDANRKVREKASPKEVELDNETLDCSTVLSSVIPIPMALPEEEEKRDSTVKTSSSRVARVKAYAPNVFTSLRSRFAIEEDDFVKSMLGTGPFVSFQSNSKGAARSGGYFFFTRDGAYMVKTIKKAEVVALLDLLPRYQKYMMRHGRGSLISRCCGIYGVQISDTSHQTGHSWLDEDEDVFIVTNSVFPAEGSQFISERFDLKGSTLGRTCSQEEREKKGSNAILKDLDLANEFRVLDTLYPKSRPRKCGINIGSRAKASLLSQLRRDTEFLVECGVMDYSLLVGVVNMDRSGKEGNLETLLSTVPEEKPISLQSRKQRAFFWRLSTPMRQLFSPPIFIAKQCFNAFDSILMSVLTLPFPYYGADVCGVHGGSHSVIPGYRFGYKAQYYFGVIDFLQPWTFRKLMEREMLSAIGYDRQSFSCVHPKDYAERFLAFLDHHII